MLRCIIKLRPTSTRSEKVKRQIKVKVKSKSYEGGEGDVLMPKMPEFMWFVLWV